MEQRKEQHLAEQVEPAVSYKNPETFWNAGKYRSCGAAEQRRGEDVTQK